MVKFLISSAITLLISILLIAWGASIGWWHKPSYGIEILVFNFFMTAVIFYYLKQMQQRQPDQFSLFYLLSIAIKLMGGLALLLAIFFLESKDLAGNAVLFLLSYLIFTSLEVVFLLLRKV